MVQYCVALAISVSVTLLYVGVEDGVPDVMITVNVLLAATALSLTYSAGLCYIVKNIKNAIGIAI